MAGVLINHHFAYSSSLAKMAPMTKTTSVSSVIITLARLLQFYKEISFENLWQWYRKTVFDIIPKENIIHDRIHDANIWCPMVRIKFDIT